MKILIFLSIKLIVLYSNLVITAVTALCYDSEGICWSTALTVKREGPEVHADIEINPCEWIDDCKIQCFSDGYTYSASEKVQSLYNVNETCHSRGVALILHRVGTYKLRPNWFSADIKLIELELDVSDIYRIEENPFAAEVFSNVEKLTFKSLCPCELKKFTLTGLHSLKNLIWKNIRFDSISSIENGVLEFVKNTLRSFELIEASQLDKEITINNFFGDNSAEMSNMEYVKIRYNLGAINQWSFTAIPNVKELDLSNCQITNIGEFTFSSLGENLELLNLERNLLATLPIGIFTDLNLSPMTDEPFLKIHLSGNPWDCDCGIDHLRQLLLDYSNFECVIFCDTRKLIQFYPIRASNRASFCPDPPNTTTTSTTIPPTTTTSTATPPTTTTTTTTSTTTSRTTSTPTTEDNTYENTSTTNDTTEYVPDFTEKQCFSSNGYELKQNVFIRYKIYQIRVTATSDQVSVLIESDEPNLALIWFNTINIPNDIPGSYHQSSFIDCVSASQNEIKLNNLNRESAYTICLIRIVDTTIYTVSPLDCISYYHYGAERIVVWLLESSKSLVISVIAGGLLTSIIVSIIIGSIFWQFSGKNKTFSVPMEALHSSKNNTVLYQGTNNPNLVNDVNGRSNFLEERLEQDLLDNPPPLPPRANSVDIEENDKGYYETIE